MYSISTYNISILYVQHKIKNLVHYHMNTLHCI